MIGGQLSTAKNVGARIVRLSLGLMISPSKKLAECSIGRIHFHYFRGENEKGERAREGQTSAGLYLDTFSSEQLSSLGLLSASPLE
jgi:hypothetical protein